MRQRLLQEAWGEVTMFMGHSQFDQITDIYAPFDPAYLSRALGVIEQICDEIEGIVPGAFRRTFAGLESNVIPQSGGKK